MGLSDTLNRGGLCAARQDRVIGGGWAREENGLESPWAGYPFGCWKWLGERNLCQRAGSRDASGESVRMWGLFSLPGGIQRVAWSAITLLSVVLMEFVLFFPCIGVKIEYAVYTDCSDRMNFLVQATLSGLAGFSVFEVSFRMCSRSVGASSWSLCDCLLSL